MDWRKSASGEVTGDYGAHNPNYTSGTTTVTG
jgi:hypothetical protein